MNTISITASTNTILAIALGKYKSVAGVNARPDPVNFFGAAMCGRTNANLSGARSIREGQRILEP